MTPSEHAQLLRELAKSSERLAAYIDYHFGGEATIPSLDLVDRARAAAAEIEGRKVPADEELLKTYGQAKREHCYEGPPDDWPKRAERAAVLYGLRALLARFGGGGAQ